MVGAPFTGDFDAMLERRLIRALVPYSRSLYYTDRGHERGLTAEALREFETWLNRKYARRLQKRPLTLVIVPTTRDELLDGLTDGRADFAAGNLTITERRLQAADFVPLAHAPGRELLVTGPASPPLDSLDHLAGRSVHVRPASSFFDSLSALSARLQAQGRPPLRLSPLPDALEDEDKLEMLSAGLLQYAVIDEWKGRLWSRVLPKIRLRDDLVLRDNVQVGWAIRKGNPALAAELQQFMRAQSKQGWLWTRAHMAKALRAQRLHDPTSGADWRRFEQTLQLFRTYGSRYGFDPLMLVAQGFQESRLQQDARSPVGAIGIMQLMPATGAQMNVGDITLAPANVHAGAKYMDHLLANYFADARFSEQERTLFAFASYNAGPGRIAQMRRLAGQRGLDPDQWFNHVEIVTAERIGMETPTYVRNIFKYYVGYRLALDAQAEQQRLRQELQGTR